PRDAAGAPLEGEGRARADGDARANRGDGRAPSLLGAASSEDERSPRERALTARGAGRPGAGSGSRERRGRRRGQPNQAVSDRAEGRGVTFARRRITDSSTTPRDARTAPQAAVPPRSAMPCALS